MIYHGRTAIVELTGEDRSAAELSSVARGAIHRLFSSYTQYDTRRATRCSKSRLSLCTLSCHSERTLVSAESPAPRRRKSLMSRLRSNSQSSSSRNATSKPILHLKFFAGSPPPEYAAAHRYAHEISADPASVDLPDGLRTDVQREGIARYLVNNFKPVRRRNSVRIRAVR